MSRGVSLPALRDVQFHDEDFTFTLVPKAEDRAPIHVTPEFLIDVLAQGGRKMLPQFISDLCDTVEKVEARRAATPQPVRGARRVGATLDDANFFGSASQVFETRLCALLDAAEDYPFVSKELFEQAVLDGLWYVEESADAPISPIQREFLDICRDFERGKLPGSAVSTAARVVRALSRTGG